MVKKIPSSAQSSKSVARILAPLALGLIVFTSSASPAGAQTFSRAFTVSPERSELEVVNQAGTIKVTAGVHQSKIVINARQSEGAAKIDATQSSMGKVKVEVTGRGRVDFEIAVPASSSIDLLSYRGAIVVTNLAGAVRARVTEGDIQIAGLRSAKVEARCTQGNVSFSGEVLPSGSYTLKSFSGRVEAILPADADFKLSASSFRGGMDLDAFQMKFNKRSHQLVEASHGAGRASISLWTQEGSIRLQRKP
jgi:DUF4097 and DUF4098 domain-containing protein YvlB